MSTTATGGGAGNAIRVRTVAAHGLAINDRVFLTGTVDPAASGYFFVTNIVNGTTFDMATSSQQGIVLAPGGGLGGSVRRLPPISPGGQAVNNFAILTNAANSLYATG